MSETDEVLQQVVFPYVHDPDVLSLYVDSDHWSSIPLYEELAEMEAQRGFVRRATDEAVLRLSDFGVLSSIRGRREFQVPHRRRVSFGTYFNAFPASYWAKWTPLEGVRLRVRTSGDGMILVHRSNARGVAQRVDSRVVRDATESIFEIPFTNVGDGGWFWFDLVAEEEDFQLVDAAWLTPEGITPAERGTASVAITTLNRVNYVVPLLEAIASDDLVASVIDRVYVIDQGTQKVRDAAGYVAVEGAFDGKLSVIEQDNLGGSGGFSRGMYETITAGESRYVLLLDDDVAVEPESIRRLIRFSDFAHQPVIAGGHMFDMYAKSHLHAFAEGFDMSNFMWGPTTPTRHDFSASNLRHTKWLHRRMDAQYNGWWMCLIPTSVVREIGLSVPVFLKWDDAEYGLRAAEDGVPTVTLPGAAVWHVSWVDKDDSIDWQAFFHARNRLLAALLHSKRPRGGRLMRANLALDVKHLFAMQYFAMAARLDAYRNILEGPEGLHAELRTRLPTVRKLTDVHPDGKVRGFRDVEVAPVQSAIEDGRWAPVYPPRGAGTVKWLGRMLARNVLRPSKTEQHTLAQAHLPFGDSKWWVVPHFDSVLVTNAEGSGAMWYRRDRATFFRMFREAWRLRARIRRQWPSLSRTYREAMPRLTSSEQWARTFAGKGDGEG